MPIRNYTRYFILLITLFKAAVALAQYPTTSASNVSFTQVYCNEVTLSWTSGDGTARIVVAKEGSAVDQVPTDNVYYLLEDSFGTGSHLGGGNYVVYNGTANTTTVKKLKANTIYHFAIYEYNGGGSTYFYKRTNVPRINTTTENIVADFSLFPTSQCRDGNETNFTNNSTISTSDGLNYKWSFNDFNVSYDKDPKHTYTSAGIYKITLEIEATGCYSKITKPDTINPHPIALFALDQARPNNDSIQCLLGNNFFFRNYTKKQSLGGISFTQYIWSFDDNATDNSLNADHEYKNSGVYDVKMVATSDQGCSDSISQKYIVLPSPASVDNVVFSDTVTCAGGEINFENNNTGIVESIWVVDEVDTIRSNNFSQTFTTLGEHRIELIATDQNGCKSAFADTILVSNITGNTFSGLKAEYCEGEPIANLAPNLMGGYFIESPGVDTANKTFNPANIGTYTVSYVYKQGSCFDTTKQTTTVFETPAFDLGADTVSCSSLGPVGLSIPLAADNYSWSTGQNTQSIAVDENGSYIGSATIGICTGADTIQVQIIQAPEVNLWGDTSVCGNVVYNVDVTNPQANYLWNDGLTTPKRTINESGFYRVEITNECGTASDSLTIEIEDQACDIFIPNAITLNDDGMNDVFRPVGKFIIKGIRIFNRWGELIYETDTEGEWNGYIEGRPVPAGVYYYVVSYQLISSEGTIQTAAGPLHVVR